MSQAEPALVVPPTLVSRSDASRLVREVEILDDTIRAQMLRGHTADISRVSQILADIAAANKLDLTNEGQRLQLKEAIRTLKSKSPVVHVIFAEEPRPEFMHQLVAWMRDTLHPATLIHVGLQPSIVAGCIVRTPSHIYDFSIQHILKSKKPMLVQALQGKQA